MNNTESIVMSGFSIYSESVQFALISSYLHLDFPQDTGVIYRGFISAMRRCANRFCVPITMNAPFVASICATTAPLSPWKPPISNGNSTAARARFQTAWRCVQFTIKPLIKVRLGWMRVCEYGCHPQ